MAGGACVLHWQFSYNYRWLTNIQRWFNSNAALLKVSIIPTGVCKDSTPLTVEITVANDISIGQGSDSDIRYGVSDGTQFIGFHTTDKANYGELSPCFGMEGVSGTALTPTRNEPTKPKPSDSFFPGQFVFTLKLDERWGSCYTAHGTAGYNNRLVLSKGLTLVVYKQNKIERVGIKYIKVAIKQDA